MTACEFTDGHFQPEVVMGQNPKTILCYCPFSRSPIQMQFVFPSCHPDLTRVEFSLDIRIVVAGIVMQRNLDVIYAESPIPPESDYAIAW